MGDTDKPSNDDGNSLEVLLDDIRKSIENQNERIEERINFSDEKQKTRIDELKSDLNSKINDLERSTRAITDAQIGMQVKLQKPWFKDGKFWAGALALPGLIASGWLVEKITDNPAVISMIHSGLGTDIAVIEAISKNSRLNPDVEASIAGQIYPRDTRLVDAINNLTRESYFQTPDFKSQLHNAVNERQPTIHLDVISLGVDDPMLLLNSDPSLPQRDGRIDEVSTTFTAFPGQSARIKLGVFITEVNMKALEELLVETDYRERERLFDSLYTQRPISSSLSDVIKVELDGEEVEFQAHNAVFSREIDGEVWDLRGFVSEKFEIRDELGAVDFPVKVISLQANNSISWDFIARVVVIVERLSDV